jgi:hypothetical protein
VVNKQGRRKTPSPDQCLIRLSAELFPSVLV